MTQTLPAVPPRLDLLVESVRALGYEEPLFESDFGRVRVQLWGNAHGYRNVIAHADARQIHRDLRVVPVHECAQIAMRSALAKALELAISDGAKPRT